MPTSSQIRVLVVDDDPIVQKSLSDYLASDPGITLVGVCSDGAEAVEAVRSHHPDVVLMDIRMPVVDGIEATRLITLASPDTRVLALSCLGDDDSINAMFAAGACGFLLKATLKGALGDAIRAANSDLASSTTLVPTAALGRWKVRPSRRAGPSLTERERQVLGALGDGDSNLEIALQLFLSESAVKAVITSLMRKLDASSRTRVIARAHELGMLPLSAKPGRWSRST